MHANSPAVTLDSPLPSQSTGGHDFPPVPPLAGTSAVEFSPVQHSHLASCKGLTLDPLPAVGATGLESNDVMMQRGALLKQPPVSLTTPGSKGCGTGSIAHRLWGKRRRIDKSVNKDEVG